MRSLNLKVHHCEPPEAVKQSSSVNLIHWIVSLTLTMTFALLLSCKACEKLEPFNVSSPLETKWSRISEWVSSDTGYIGIADVQTIVGTDFFKDFIAKDKGKTFPLFKGFDVETDAGIIVGTGNIIYIGGCFDPNIMTEKILAALKDDGSENVEESYKGYKIYSDKATGNAFTFLEKFLLCQGNIDAIKKLVDDKKAGRIEPPQVETTHPLWLQLNKGSYGPSNLNYMIFAADIDKTMKVKGSTKFSTPEEAAAFAEQLEGIKTIKTVQSIDDPWLTTLINDISVEQSGDIVRVYTSFDVNRLRKVLKGLTK